MFKLPIPTRLTDYLGEAVVWTVIIHKINRRTQSRDNSKQMKILILTVFQSTAR